MGKVLKFKKRSDKRTVIGIVAVIGVATIATVALAYYMIESLNENSEKMRLYHVKPSHESQALIDVVKDADTSKDFPGRHPLSAATNRQAQDAKARKDYKSAIELYKLSMEQFQTDLKVSKQQDRDTVMTLGWTELMISQCYLELKNYKKALEYVNYAIKREPITPYFDHRATIHDAMGDKVAAANDRLEGVKASQEDKDMRKDVQDILIKSGSN